MERLIAFFCLSACPLLYAAEITDECVQCMQRVYKFYYQEIQPKNPDMAPKLGDSQTAHMNAVIADLKSQCPPPVVAKMNQLLQQDKA